ncbi:helix-turn-helix transcriptional regulator [Streptomyces sp. NPDC002467]|uniref:helix-turn-helix transcriptional regulator n=1 Tax=Streptomyces sp. NPDC002467 TaxID=3364647 RepID=UPI0036822A07
MHALRTGAGLSQEELAQAAGSSVRALSDLERGRTRGRSAAPYRPSPPSSAWTSGRRRTGRHRPPRPPPPRPRSEAGPATRPETRSVPYPPPTPTRPG